MACRPATAFSDAVKRVLPHARAKRLSCGFEVRGPDVLANVDAIDLECSVHRLICGAIDLLHSGRLVFGAEVRLTPLGRCKVDLVLFGAGVVADAAAMTAVIERLALQEDGATPADGGLRLRRASGTCPRTGALVHLAALRSGGISIRAEATFGLIEAEAKRPDAAGAQAWLVDSCTLAAQSLSARLQRLGWKVLRFDSPREALRAMRPDRGAAPQPHLCIVSECQSFTPADVARLGRALPDATQRVYCALLGSATLAEGDLPGGFITTVQPLAPARLHALTASVASRSNAPAAKRNGRTALLAVAAANDDSVAAAARALGIETWLVDDAQAAIDHCRQAPPAALLLGVATAQLLHTARTLRQLQTRGEIAPFAILAMAPAGEPLPWSCVDTGIDALLAQQSTPTQRRADLARFLA